MEFISDLHDFSTGGEGAKCGTIAWAKALLKLNQGSLTGDVALVKEAINEGAEINFNNGEALLYAVRNNRKEVIYYLIDNGANPNADKEYDSRIHGENILDLVVKRKMWDVLAYFMKNSDFLSKKTLNRIFGLNMNNDDVVTCVIENIQKKDLDLLDYMVNKCPGFNREMARVAAQKKVLEFDMIPTESKKKLKL